MVDITGLNPGQQDAYAAMSQLLQAVGLGSLSTVLWSYIVNDYSEDTITLLIQDTPEWKQRFAGNEERKRLGLPVLSPMEYLDVETAYKTLMRSYGLPAGFYDDPADFAEAIGNGVSPNELQERLELRRRVYTSGEMTGVADYMRAYGFNDGDTVAFYIDPDRALPLLRKQVEAAEIGAAARAAKFGSLDALDALRLAERGISEQMALEGFAAAAERLSLTEALPGQTPDTVTSRDLVAAQFEGDAEARRKVERVAATRVAQFEGESSFATTEEGFTGIGSVKR